MLNLRTRADWVQSRHGVRPDRPATAVPSLVWSTLVHAFVTALGWTGAVTCIVAYALVTRGTWAPTSRRFQLANIVGALLLTSVSARSHVWPSVASNVIWAAIGIQAMVLVARTRRSTTRTGAGSVPSPDVRDEPVRRQGEVGLVA